MLAEGPALLSKDWNVTLWMSWDAREGPLHIPKREEK